MRRLVAIFCLLFAWVCANDGVLDFLQVAAWGHMFAGYVKTMSVTAAVEQTFDLGKPCKLCMSVRKDLAKQQQSMPDEVSMSAGRMLLYWQCVQPVVPPGPRGHRMEYSVVRAVTRCDPVPYPPPKIAVGHCA